MRMDFEYASEIDDGTGLVTMFKVMGHVTCYDVRGRVSYEIEDIINLQTRQSLEVNDLPLDEQTKLKAEALNIAEENARYAYQEYIEGLGIFQDDEELHV